MTLLTIKPVNEDIKKGKKIFLQTIIFIIFWDFWMVEKIFFSQQRDY